MLTALKYFLVAVEIITCLLLLVVILVQRTKNQGLGMALGGAMGESMFGAQMGNVLTKTTVVLAIIFLVTTTLLAMIGARTSGGESSVVDKSPVPAPAMPSQMAPSGGVQEEGAPGTVEEVEIPSLGEDMEESVQGELTSEAEETAEAVPEESIPADTWSDAAEVPADDSSKEE